MSGHPFPLFQSLIKRLLLTRIALSIVLPFTLFLAVFYQVEKIRGRQALEQSVIQFTADGESLNFNDFLKSAPSAENNFGATTFLDGLMLSEESDPAFLTEAQRKRDYFTGLAGPVAFVDPSPESTIAGVVVARDVDWKKTRRTQSYRSPKRKPPSEEPSDVRAMDKVLDLQRAVFEELALAAQRPHAVFTPVRLNRPFQKNLTFPFFKGSPILQLRLQAATALGRLQEAADLARVFWRLREATLHESGFLGYIWAGKAGADWCDGVTCLLRSPRRDAALLAQLQSQIPADWSPKGEMLQASRFSAADINLSWTRIIEQATNHFSGDLDGQFVEHYYDDTKLALFSPMGWLGQNAAETLRLHRLHRLQPLRKMDFTLLPAAQATLPPHFFRLSPYRRWVPDYKNAADLEFAVYDTIRIQLTFLTLALERYRLEFGRYPVSAHDLVPDYIRSIPPDIDAQPLRLATFREGAKAVVYSIGWNMKDDWRGQPPAALEKGTSPVRQPDWIISLPLPPLPEP